MIRSECLTIWTLKQALAECSVDTLKAQKVVRIVTRLVVDIGEVVVRSSPWDDVPFPGMRFMSSLEHTTWRMGNTKMIEDDCICDLCDFVIKYSTLILDLIILKWWWGRWVVHVGCKRHMHWDWHSHWLQRSRGGLVVSTWHPRKEAWLYPCFTIHRYLMFKCLGNCSWDKKMDPF